MSGFGLIDIADNIIDDFIRELDDERKPHVLALGSDHNAFQINTPAVGQIQGAADPALHFLLIQLAELEPALGDIFYLALIHPTVRKVGRASGGQDTRGCFLFSGPGYVSVTIVPPIRIRWLGCGLKAVYPTK